MDADEDSTTQAKHFQKTESIGFPKLLSRAEIFSKIKRFLEVL